MKIYSFLLILILFTSSASAHEKNQKISPYFLQSEQQEIKNPKLLQAEKTYAAIVYLEDAEKIRTLENYTNIEAISGSQVQVRGTYRKLKEISDLTFVSYVRKPLYSHTDVVSEGVARVGVQTFHDHSVRGKNVSIAVLDAGFHNYQSRQGTELPYDLTAISFRADHDISGAGEDHGTAVAEIVYDTAPESKMYLINYETELEFKAAVYWLIGQHVNIITHSAGWTAGAFDGTGYLDDIVNSAIDNGTVWINSAGNYADKHWEGRFVDQDFDGWHEFNGSDEYQEINASAGELIEVTLSWDDDWQRASQDYELFLLDRNGMEVASSENEQSGRRGQEPVEQIEYFARYDGTYKIGIKKYGAARDVFLELYSSTHELEYKVASSSLAIPSDVQRVITVGATWYYDDSLETFSSQGPTNDNRIKPDIVSPDGVSTVTYGTHSFFGTSASAPLAAGSAALLLSAADISHGEVKEVLENSALDLGVPGKDNLYGSGRINLSGAYKQVSASSFTITHGTIYLPDMQGLRSVVVTVQLKNMLGRNVREARNVTFNISGGILPVLTGTTGPATGQLNITISGNTSLGAVSPVLTVSVSGMPEQSLTLNMFQPVLSVSANISSVTVNNSMPVQFTVSTDSIKVDGAAVTLSGAANVSAVTDADGRAVITVNGSHPGIITAVAARQGYVSGNTRFAVQREGAGTLAAINVLPGNASIISGDTKTFTASGFDSNGTDVVFIPFWHSSNTTVGEINAATGVFTSIKTGTTIIRAYNESQGSYPAGQANITVVPGALSRISISPSTAIFEVNSTHLLKASGTDANGNAVNFVPVWNVGNANAGIVNESTGMFTALNEGAAVVTASSDNLTGRANVSVVARLINGTITGLVTNASSGDAVAGANVTASGISTASDAGGSYSINILPGEYVITANASGYNASSVSAAVGNGARISVNFTLLPEISNSLIRTYDKNSSGTIERNEAVLAVIDYFAGTISRQGAMEVVLAYFNG